MTKITKQNSVWFDPSIKFEKIFNCIKKRVKSETDLADAIGPKNANKSRKKEIVDYFLEELKEPLKEYRNNLLVKNTKNASKVSRVCLSNLKKLNVIEKNLRRFYHSVDRLCINQILLEPIDPYSEQFLNFKHLCSCLEDLLEWHEKIRQFYNSKPEHIYAPRTYLCKEIMILFRLNKLKITNTWKREDAPEPEPSLFNHILAICLYPERELDNANPTYELRKIVAENLEFIEKLELMTKDEFKKFIADMEEAGASF